MAAFFLVAYRTRDRKQVSGFAEASRGDLTSWSLFQPEVLLGLVSPQTRLPDPLRES